MVKSIQYKLILIYILLLLFAFEILGVFLINALESYYVEEFRHSIKSQSQLLSNFIARHLYEDPDIPTINQLVREFSQPLTNTEIYVISNGGIVLSTSRGKEKYINTRIVQHEVTRAIMGTPGEAVRANPDTGTRNYFYAVPVVHEQIQVGTIYIIAPLHNVDNTLARVRNILITGTIATMLLTAGLGFFVAKTITQPIKDVTQKAEAMAQGDYEGKIDVKAKDEIGQLGTMFNYLAEKLQESIGEISEEKNKTEVILKNLTDGVVAFDKEGNVIHQNPLAERLLKVKKSVKLLDILFNSEEEFHNYLQIKEIQKRQKEIKGKTLLLNYVPFASEKGSTGLIVVINDITEREQLEYMRRQFVADVSHELRTPLTSIKSYVEALQNGGIDNKDISKKFLGVVEDETDRMVRMVKDLLMITRLDYKKEGWYWKKIDLMELLELIVTKVDLQIKEKKQNVIIDFGENIPEIIGDMDKLQQLFINLFTNSMKYTQPEGTIKISANKLDTDEIEITIEDNGIGIPKSDLPRIFDRFYRVDKARSREMGGTGLGLAIAKQIVEGHKGSINISSEEGMGTKVTVKLPIKLLVEEES